MSEVNVESPPGGYRALTGLVAGALIVAALYFAKDILLPVTLAVLLSFVLAPLVRLLRSIGIPRVIGVLFSVLVALALMGGVASLVTSEIVDVARDLPAYQYTIEKKVNGVRRATVGWISELSSHFQGALGRSISRSGSAGSAGSGSAGEPQHPPLPVELHQPPPDPLTLARTIVLPLLSPLAAAAIVFVVTVFILMQQQDLRDRVIRLFGTRDLHRTTLAMDDAASRLGRYFLVQIAVNFTFGTIIAAGLYFIGLPQPLLWGILAGLLRFVPYIGSFIAAAIPILLAAAVDPGWSSALWVAGLFLVTEPIMGQVVEPLAYGRSTGLSPIAVIIAAIFWGWIWGPVGLILSTPLTLCMVVLGRHVEQLEFISIVLGDKPPLTRAENFYQRILADDLDEVHEQAEEILKSVPLVSYYDDVVMRALELAARDRARGALSSQQLLHIKEALLALIDDLHEYEQMQQARRQNSHDGEDNAAENKVRSSDETEHRLLRKQATLSSPAARLSVVAARTDLDEAAAAMLGQLLQEEGLRVELAGKDAVARSANARFSGEGAGICCICSVDAVGTTSRLRFLLRRLRRRAPETRLIAVIWPGDHPIRNDRTIMERLGADLYAGSLREALDACLHIAHQRAAVRALPQEDIAVEAASLT